MKRRKKSTSLLASLLTGHRPSSVCAPRRHKPICWSRALWPFLEQEMRHAGWPESCKVQCGASHSARALTSQNFFVGIDVPTAKRRTVPCGCWPHGRTETSTTRARTCTSRLPATPTEAALYEPAVLAMEPVLPTEAALYEPVVLQVLGFHDLVPAKVFVTPTG